MGQITQLTPTSGNGFTAGRSINATPRTQTGGIKTNVIPSNASVPSSSKTIYYNGYNASFEDLLRAIADQNNAFNVVQTEQVNAFNAREAQKQRDWLERMSNTAHQREVADLQKSGLNPVLSALNGNGAYVGNASSASGQKAVADNTLGNGIISLLAAMINASSAASVASIYANASMYAADKGLEGSKYSVDTNKGVQSAHDETSEKNAYTYLKGDLARGLLSALGTGIAYKYGKKTSGGR